MTQQPAAPDGATSPLTTLSVAPMRSELVSPRDALRAALVEVISRERQAWEREREVIEVQARAAIAEMRAENATLRAEREVERAEFRARMEEMIATRLATLRDGVDGAPGERGPQGEPGPAARFRLR